MFDLGLIRTIVTSMKLQGKTFGRLTVLEHFAGRKWVCLCVCGGLSTPFDSQLTSGKTQSCGCIRKETSALQGGYNRTHGMKGTRPYRIWCGMLNRCRNPNEPDYARYGGAGIRVCRRWHDFGKFWADMARGYAPDLQIDRRDYRKGYVKSNCRWATPTQQQRNRSSNVWIDTPKGRMVLSQAAEVFGLPYGRLKMRRKMGWSEQEILSQKEPYVRRAAS